MAASKKYLSPWVSSWSKDLNYFFQLFLLWGIVTRSNYKNLIYFSPNSLKHKFVILDNSLLPPNSQYGLEISANFQIPIVLTEDSLGIKAKLLFLDIPVHCGTGQSWVVLWCQCSLWCTALLPLCSESVTHSTGPALLPWLQSVSSRLLWKGSQQALGVDDLWPVRKQDCSEEIVALAEREWKKCHSRSQQWVFDLESTSWAQLASSRWSKQIHSQVLMCRSAKSDFVHKIWF